VFACTYLAAHRFRRRYLVVCAASSVQRPVFGVLHLFVGDILCALVVAVVPAGPADRFTPQVALSSSAARHVGPERRRTVRASSLYFVGMGVCAVCVGQVRVLFKQTRMRISANTDDCGREGNPEKVGLRWGSERS